MGFNRPALGHKPRLSTSITFVGYDIGDTTFHKRVTPPLSMHIILKINLVRIHDVTPTMWGRRKYGVTTRVIVVKEYTCLGVFKTGHYAPPFKTIAVGVCDTTCKADTRKNVIRLVADIDPTRWPDRKSVV
jgi:hypothetical protein